MQLAELRAKIENVGSEELQSINADELRLALRQIKHNKRNVEDGNRDDGKGSSDFA